MPVGHDDARDEALREGRALRRRVPRCAHAAWKPPSSRADPITTLGATDARRLPHLIPLRYGRMCASPFAFLRGSPAIMAADLASTPTTGLRVQACGDCHLGNFGAFASPERRLLFDINDFDETLNAPWEFDLKRLATSFTLLARSQGRDRHEAHAVTRAMLGSYRRRLREFAGMSPLDTWYFGIDSQLLIRTAPDPATRRRRERFERAARKRTGESLVGHLVVERKGALRFREQPPQIVRLRRIHGALESNFRAVLARYPLSLSDDRRALLSRYRLSDLAFKVVGVGSVGTRCAAALYLSQGGDPLVLQVKEAGRSVLEPIAGPGGFTHQGHRVVTGQRLMQCASDIFLGWASDDDGHDYYIRQLRDMKTSVPLEALTGPVLFNHAEMCGWALARAHAKAGDAARLSGYIGRKDALDDALTRFADAYADECERDFEAFKRAIRAGKIPVELG